MEPRTAFAAREKRSEPRWRTRLQSAKILDVHGRFLIDRRIYDRSAHGARLRLAAHFVVPGRIGFVDELANQSFDAKVAWQRNQEIGVRILSRAK
ncbi:MAG: PilZ domain-containing protein [Beijerinckiaceae bacterium]